MVNQVIIRSFKLTYYDNRWQQIFEYSLLIVHVYVDENGYEYGNHV
jgi:hypothetical protein